MCVCMIDQGRVQKTERNIKKKNGLKSEKLNVRIRAIVSHYCFLTSNHHHLH